MSFSKHFFALLDWGRRTNAVDSLSASFVRDASRHRIALESTDQDDIGKAIPEPVIRQLDAHLDTLGTARTRGKRTLAAPDLQLMYRTLYTVLRDTGRRPLEVVSLPRDCLETQGDQTSLIWHNHKAHRMRRRLPITAGTADTIRAWQHRRDQLDSLPPAGAAHLFPALTYLATWPHLPTNYLGETMREWVDSLPTLHSEGVDSDSNPLPFDRTLICPYAFRHSYAQRHADAGTPVDVLCELMDHREIRTTQRYYTVSQKRKREAVTKLSAHVLDIHGHPRPCTTNSYELRSVAVPYGGCTEPSNVKAGGRACPIRFQCAGCGFYRPDPSYLPAIEQHLNELRADREAALAIDAQDFVVSAPTTQITAFENVTAHMRSRLDALTPDERAQIEYASTVLRKARAGTVHAPLPVYPPTSGAWAMNPQGNPTSLAKARRRDSLDKRERVLTALAAFEHEGRKITHADLARTAHVSTWLTCTPGLREHIEAAQRRQQIPLPPTSEHGAHLAPAATLRTELELAREEIHELRQAKDRLQQALRYQLGQQLDDLTTPDLSARVEELTRRNQELLDQLHQATAQTTALQEHTDRLEDDLAAARTSLRRMIREENRN